MKMECLREKNYQEDSWQENYLDSQTNGTTKNIGENWRGIEDGGRKNNQEEKK